MQINPEIFREYDIRGIAGKDLDESSMETIGKAYVAYMRGKRKHNCVVLGRDGRLTGRDYANALIDGVTSCGMNVIDIGMSASPPAG